MPKHADARRNRLVAAMTHADWHRWRPHLECVTLTKGQVLCEPGRPQRYAYFPVTAVVSLLCTLASGASAEIAVVGKEGVVGISLFLSGGSASNGSTVLITGQGFRIGAQVVQDEFARSGDVRRLLLRYTQALASQIAQTAICNRHHSVEQQLCSFLLHTLDRLRGNDIAVTQDLIAVMLGVRRESVSGAAGQLQAAGLIDYRRGHIAVRNRSGLARRSCECHAAVKAEYDRLLPCSTPDDTEWAGLHETADPEPVSALPWASSIGQIGESARRGSLG